MVNVSLVLCLSAESYCVKVILENFLISEDTTVFIFCELAISVTCYISLIGQLEAPKRVRNENKKNRDLKKLYKYVYMWPLVK